MAYFLINRNEKITTDMAENTSNKEAKQMEAVVEAASKVATVAVVVASVVDKTSNTSICNRLMRYLDSFSEEKILFPTSSMMKKIFLEALDLDKWEWDSIGREPTNNQLVAVVKTEIHSAWEQLLEAWEEASMMRTFSAAVDSAACR
jgi:hypothetical protein